MRKDFLSEDYKRIISGDYDVGAIGVWGCFYVCRTTSNVAGWYGIEQGVAYRKCTYTTKRQYVC